MPPRSARSLAQKLIESHRIGANGSELRPGAEVAIRIDQTLTQDATGTLVMLTLESIGIERVRTELSAQYVDHSLLQTDYRNADDHLFLESACKRMGIFFSRPGNGVSHPLHMQLFGRPCATLLGADSHTCAAGSLGMLAIGAGGLDVAMAMAGEPFHFTMPRVFGVRLSGKLPEWVSAKDVILELLRRHGVRGGRNTIFEYFGPGLASLSAMDRHVIANMGAELGATTSVFPSDEMTRAFLERHGRGRDFRELSADEGAGYDEVEEIDLGSLVPLIAKPSSPDNVVPVRDVAGEPIYQAYIGSSANPGFRDFAIAALMVRGRSIADGVSFDINPATRGDLEDLSRTGLLADLIHAGARLHQAGCNGCIGMGQAPATGRNSLRTTPRNFPGRSGTKEDSVWLCSPETATASALWGVITDPRDLGLEYRSIAEPDRPSSVAALVTLPLVQTEARRVELARGPNIADLPELAPLPESLELGIAIKVGHDVSTDEILPAGSEVLSYRSNIPKIAEYCFMPIDPDFVRRTRSVGGDGFVVVAGANYGQGSSREHAALAPRFLGLRLVLALSYARIHHQNLINYGVLPLVFASEHDYERLETGARLELRGLRAALGFGNEIDVFTAEGLAIRARHSLTAREIEIVRAGGAVGWARRRLRLPSGRGREPARSSSRASS